MVEPITKDVSLDYLQRYIGQTTSEDSGGKLTGPWQKGTTEANKIKGTLKFCRVTKIGLEYCVQWCEMIGEPAID